MTKAQLRTLYKARRQALSAEDVARASAQILQLFQQYADAALPACIHTFLPIRQQNEVDTWPIIHWLWQHHPAITVVTSVSDFETGTLAHYALTPDTNLLINRHGIPEPDPTISVPVPLSAIDMVLIPLLVVDRRGHRIGYGKGFYDRFLAQCRSDCLKVGLSLFDLIEEIENVVSTDVSLTACITPTAILPVSST